MKNKEQRKCISCNKIDKKENLIRIVKNKNGKISVDFEQKADGRGAYICKNEECLSKMIKSRKLNKSFKQEINIEDYEKLRGVIVDK